MVLGSGGPVRGLVVVELSDEGELDRVRPEDEPDPGGGGELVLVRLAFEPSGGGGAVERFSPLGEGAFDVVAPLASPLGAGALPVAAVFAFDAADIR